MNKSLAGVGSESPRSDSDGTNQNMLIAPTCHTSSFAKKDHSWYVISRSPTDFTIRVQDVTFYAHKYSLVAKSGYLRQIELHPSNSNYGYDIKLENIPGGSDVFEMVLKFCYGVPIDLNPTNVAQLRCAAEYLDMSEELEEGNLISKTEAFLTFIVLSSWRDCITVLKSCESLSPWAENLQIVRRCSDSIAWKASREGSTEELTIEAAWWFADVATLRIDHLMRVLAILKAKGLKPEILGSCIMHYAEKWLPSMDMELEGQRRYSYRKNYLKTSISSGRREEYMGQSKEQRMIIENLISILPPQKEAVPCKFLLWLLKMAMFFSATPALISELEKRAGMVLDDANAEDLLIPSFKNGDQGKMVKGCTVHDIDVVRRMVEYFLMHEEQQQQHEERSRKFDVGKLLDNYLAEIAKDQNISITEFQVLAEALPENARASDDGLYRAVDTYVKTHPTLSEHDRRRICKVMNCDKLSLDACTHAAQNDRLPLRTIMQVLFSVQVKMRAAMQPKDPEASTVTAEQEGDWSITKEVVKALKAELERVKMKMAELQRDYNDLQREYGNLSNKPRNISSWSLGWKKIRKSAVFQGKLDGEDDGEEQQRQDQAGRKVNFRRRASLS